MTAPQEIIFVGSRPKDGTGDDLRSAGQKINDNFSVLFATAGAGMRAPRGRLTLASGTALTESDITGATTVFDTASGDGNLMPIFNGVNFDWYSVPELSLALDSNPGHTGYHQSGKNYDFFTALKAAVPVLGTGPDWSAGAVPGSNTVRGTGAGSTDLQTINGVWTNRNPITLRVGTNINDTISVAANQATFRGSAGMTANGVTEDSRLKRLLSNAYNRQPRPLLRAEPAGISWVYVDGIWRQANANTANQVVVLNCLAGIRTRVAVAASVVGSGAVGYASVGIGIDSSTLNSAVRSGYTYESGTGSIPWAEYTGCPGLGYHELRWLEYFKLTSGAGATWYASDNSGDNRFKSSIAGEIET